MPVIANGVVRALSSVSDDFCGTTVALIVSPSTREMVRSSLRQRSNGISSVNMVLSSVWDCATEPKQGMRQAAEGSIRALLRWTAPPT